LDHVDGSTVRYRHCSPGEAAGLSLVQIGEGADLNGGGTQSLGDTDDLYAEDLIPELGESDAEKVRQTLAAKPAAKVAKPAAQAAKGAEGEAEEDAKRAVKEAQLHLDAAKKRAAERASGGQKTKGAIKAAVTSAVKNAVADIADQDVANALKQLTTANTRLTEITGKKIDPKKKKIDDAIAKAKATVMKLKMSQPDTKENDKVKLAGDIAVAEAKLGVAQSDKRLFFATKLSKPTLTRELKAAQEKVKAAQANADLSVAKQQLFHASSEEHTEQARQAVKVAKKKVAAAESALEQYSGPGYAAQQAAKRAQQDVEFARKKLEKSEAAAHNSPGDDGLALAVNQRKQEVATAKSAEAKAMTKAKQATSAAESTLREKAAAASEKAQRLKVELSMKERTMADLKGSQADPKKLAQLQAQAKGLSKEHRQAVAMAADLATQLSGKVSAEVQATTQRFTAQMAVESETRAAKKKVAKQVFKMKKRAKSLILKKKANVMNEAKKEAKEMKSEAKSNLKVMESNAQDTAHMLAKEGKRELRSAQQQAKSEVKKAKEDANQLQRKTKQKVKKVEEKEKVVLADAKALKDKELKKLSEARQVERKADAKASETVRLAEGNARAMEAKEVDKLARAKEQEKQKAAQEISDATQRAEKILHRARKAEREKLKGNADAEGAVALSGANTIKASPNRYLCLKKTFTAAGHLGAISYMECHKHATCNTAKGVSCKCQPCYTGTVARCNMIDCGTVEPPANGVVRCPKGTVVGESCLMSCIDGYTYFGPPRLKCMDSGMFKSIAVKRECKKIECDVFKVPTNSETACAGNAYGDACTIRCKTGYLLEGSSDVSCQASGDAARGSWIGNAGKSRCRKIDCKAPAVPAGATVNCRGTTFGKKCEFSCAGNAKRLTPFVHLCGANGRWQGEQVQCQKLKCEKLGEIGGGRAMCSGNSVGDHCRGICDEGMQLIGPKKRLCKVQKMGNSAVAQWNGSPNRCEQIKCGEHKSVINGEAKCGETQKYGESCDIVCDQGYTRDGPARRTCGSDGKWSGNEPKCKVLDCGPLAKPTGGAMSCDGTIFEKICDFSCKRGLELRGSQKRQCGKDGFWKGKPTYCGTKSCKRLTDPLNGRLMCDGVSFSSSCTFRCNKGYTLKGSVKRYCGEDSKWNGKDVACVPTKCGSPADPSHGTVKCNGDAYGNVCNFKCNTGYELSGPTSVRRCKSNGYWSGVAVQCKPRDCGKLSAPPDGMVNCPRGTTKGNSCLFKCNPGSKLTDKDSANRVCQPTGEWTGTLAECTPVDCGQPKVPKGAVANCKAGTQTGSTCKLQCQSGFRVAGQGLLRCMNDGKWAGSTECVEVNCPEPPKPSWGTIKCSGNTLGKDCTFGCKKGYNLAGSPVRTCMESGRWNGKQPSCIAANCAALKQLPGGTMKCTARNGAFSSGNIRYGDACDFKCAKGYEIEGSKERMCQDDGSWSGSTSACAPLDCKPPAAIQGCEVKCEQGTTLNKECSIKGRKGHTLAGGTKEAKIQCMPTGKWSQTKAKCVAAKCPSLDEEVAGFGKVICSNNNFRDSKCGLQCNNNLVRHGPRIKECAAGSKWSPGKFGCKPLPSKALEVAAQGDQDPAFTFYSTAGDVSLRLESMGTTARSAYLELANGKKDAKSSWMVGMLGNYGMSICYGTATGGSSNKCPLKIAADGTVHIHGSAFFHDKAVLAKVVDEKSPIIPVGDKINQKKDEVAGKSNSTGTDGSVVSLAKSELGEDGLNDGELPGMQSLIQVSEGKKKVDPEYHIKVGGDGQQTPAAKWKSEGGKVGIRLESQNALEPKNVYLEMRNKGRRDGWGVGLRKDLGFYFGYGMVSTWGLGTKKNYMKVSPNKGVSFYKDVVFYHMPSYFKAGTPELNLVPQAGPMTELSKEPSYGKLFSAKTTSAKEVPDRPNSADGALGMTSSAEPLIAFNSKDNVSIRVSSISAGALKDAFMEFRSQKKSAWRLAVHSDGDLYVTYHSQEGAPGAKAIRLTQKGAVHFYGEVQIGGKAIKKF